MEEQTINDVFRNRSGKYGERLAVEKKYNGTWEKASWGDYYDRSCSVGLGLLELGVSKGDLVSLLSENRLEWLYTDMGTLGIGACLVPFYGTLSCKMAHEFGVRGFIKFIRDTLTGRWLDPQLVKQRLEANFQLRLI